MILIVFGITGLSSFGPPIVFPFLYQGRVLFWYGSKMDMAMINFTDDQISQLRWIILTGEMLGCRNMSEIETFILILAQIVPKWTLSWISNSCSCLWESAKHTRVQGDATPHLLASNLFYMDSARVISADLTDSSGLGQTQGSLRRRTETKLGTFSKTLTPTVDSWWKHTCIKIMTHFAPLCVDDCWWMIPELNSRPGHLVTLDVQ